LKKQIERWFIEPTFVPLSIQQLKSISFSTDHQKIQFVQQMKQDQTDFKNLNLQYHPLQIDIIDLQFESFSISQRKEKMKIKLENFFKSNHYYFKKFKSNFHKKSKEQ
jgi:hypothetical protein